MSLDTGMIESMRQQTPSGEPGAGWAAGSIVRNEGLALTSMGQQGFSPKIRQSIVEFGQMRFGCAGLIDQFLKLIQFRGVSDQIIDGCRASTNDVLGDHQMDPTEVTQASIHEIAGENFAEIRGLDISPAYDVGSAPVAPSSGVSSGNGGVALMDI